LTDDAENDVGRLSRLKLIAELENGGQRTSTPSSGSLGGSSWNRKSIVESVVRRTQPMDFPLRVIVALVVIGAFAGVGEQLQSFGEDLQTRLVRQARDVRSTSAFRGVTHRSSTTAHGQDTVS